MSSRCLVTTATSKPSIQQPVSSENGINTKCTVSSGVFEDFRFSHEGYKGSLHDVKLPLYHQQSNPRGLKPSQSSTLHLTNL